MTGRIPAKTCILCIFMFAIAVTAPPALAQPVLITVETDQTFDSVYTPKPVSIIFNVDANGAEIAALTFPMGFTFTNGNIIGPIHEGTEFTGESVFIYSEKSKSVFESLPFHASMGVDFVDAPYDTLLWSGLDFGGGGWTGAGEFMRITFMPTDTGSITIDSTFLPPACCLYVMDPSANGIPFEWEAPTIYIPKQPGPVKLAVKSSYDSDTLFMGGNGWLSFSVDANGHNIAGLSFPVSFDFSGPNIIGPVNEGNEFLYADYAEVVFESLAFNAVYGTSVTAPDTLLWSGADFDLAGWTSASEMAKVRFNPIDTGRFTVDLVVIPPASQFNPIDQDGQPLDYTWQSRTFEVAPCPVTMGDVNDDGSITSADIIYLVNTVFRGGPSPLPRPESGDVACKGRLDAAGIIYLVGYIFKGGSPPCECFPTRIY